MDKIPLSGSDVAPLDDVATDIVGLKIIFVNVFAIGEPDNWVLIDGGLHLSAGRIRSWAEKHFGEAKPQAILLTHGHFDHVGAVEELANGWDVPVYAHPQEMPYVTGQAEYPPPDPGVGGGLMAIMSPLYPRGPYDFRPRLRELPADGSVPHLQGWQWIHTPGHTAGHISFFREQDGALIVGDAFCTTKPESFFAATTGYPELHGPPAYFTPDWDSARTSVQRLAELRPTVVAPGHGLPMMGMDVAEKLSRLADEFDQIARPEKDREAA
ncbi:MAG: fold metallo-hydrolase [Acidobacteriales bacterium]|nr:fold metallo-hydrolase [Terriglobales bacterium]